MALDYNTGIIDYQNNILTLVISAKVIDVKVHGEFKNVKYKITPKVFEKFLLTAEDREDFFIEHIKPNRIEDEPNKEN